MLSYRHAFHAGNHADMLKHLCLYLVQDYFNQKDKPYWYIDTHAGTGLYHLKSTEANKVGEYADGIARLREHKDSLPTPLKAFIEHVNSTLPEPHQDFYCGSPWLAASLLRATDKMRLFELHPKDAEHLINNIRETAVQKRTIIKNANGFDGLIALLPPATRRAVVLIDPPYEVKTDYQQVYKTLQDALKRFAEGCYMVWYPVLSREESRTFPDLMKKLCPDNYLSVQLHVQGARDDGFGMHGSGMWIINPPYTLAKTLEELMPVLCETLAQDNQAHYQMNYKIR